MPPKTKKVQALKIGTVHIESVGPPLQLSKGTRKAVLASAQQYVDTGVYGPLDSGTVASGYAALFESPIRAAATTVDRGALTEIPVGKADKYSAKASPVAVSGLVDGSGALVVPRNELQNGREGDDCVGTAQGHAQRRADVRSEREALERHRVPGRRDSQDGRRQNHHDRPDRVRDDTVKIMKRHRRVRNALLAIGAFVTALVFACGGIVAAWMAGYHVPLASGTTYLRVAKIAPLSGANRAAGTPNGPFFILLVGNDDRPGVGGARGDALHLVGVNPAKHRASMIDIPRDTCWQGDKINVGNTRGPRAQAQAVGGLDRCEHRVRRRRELRRLPGSRRRDRRHRRQRPDARCTTPIQARTSVPAYTT